MGFDFTTFKLPEEILSIIKECTEKRELNFNLNLEHRFSYSNTIRGHVDIKGKNIIINIKDSLTFKEKRETIIHELLHLDLRLKGYCTFFPSGNYNVTSVLYCN